MRRNYFSVFGIKIPNFLKCKSNTRYFILCGNSYIEEKKKIIKKLVNTSDCIQGFYTIDGLGIKVYISFIHVR